MNIKSTAAAIIAAVILTGCSAAEGNESINESSEAIAAVTEQTAQSEKENEQPKPMKSDEKRFMIRVTSFDGKLLEGEKMGMGGGRHFQMPADGSMPEKMTPPEMPADGNMTEGMTPPEMPADGSMPEGMMPPEIPADGNMHEGVQVKYELDENMTVPDISAGDTVMVELDESGAVISVEKQEKQEKE